MSLSYIRVLPTPYYTPRQYFIVRYLTYPFVIASVEYLIAAKVLVVLVVSVVVSALILTVVAAIRKEGSIHSLTGVFLLLYIG